MGQALERVATEASAAQAREAAALQGTRNALLAAIAHDYRTPLACILSAASSLQDQDARLAPPQRARLLGSIVDETEALARLTDNSLQIARLESGEVSLQLDWESIEEIVGAVLRRSRQRRDLGTTETAEARVRARLEPGLPLLRCDALLLIQLLNNLVDNGLKYGGPAGVEILARAALKDGERWVVLAARDRGPGVPPGWRDRVFEAFQRGESPTESNRRGAGVGLAACRAIARAHRGDMRYRARGHGGASFECWLPWPETAQIEA
jgi:two-component system sensor histidine kinase KdpD